METPGPFSMGGSPESAGKTGDKADTSDSAGWGKTPSGWSGWSGWLERDSVVKDRGRRSEGQCRTGRSCGWEMTLLAGGLRGGSGGWAREVVWLTGDCQHDPDPSPVGRRWRAAPDEGRWGEAAKPPPDRRPSPFRARTTAAPPCAQPLSRRERGTHLTRPGRSATIRPGRALESSEAKNRDILSA